jgi:hypothetical protein
MGRKFEYRRSVRHRCGHTVNHHLHGHNRQEADRWAHNLRKVDCPACRDNNLSRNPAIDKKAREIDFPALCGSAGEVAWAGAVRSRIHGSLSRSDRYHDVACLCRHETSAAWWIEHRADKLGDIAAHLRHLERGREDAA